MSDLAGRQRDLGVPILPDTAHETVQVYVMDRIKKERGAVLFCEGCWWVVGPLGAWILMTEETIWTEVQALNGLETLEGAKDEKPGKPIRVTAGMCESVCALARARYIDDHAFECAASGFVTPAGLWECSAAEGWTCRPPTPHDRVRLYIAADPDLTASPVLWCAALYRMWGHESDYAERCAWLHEWWGATLCGDVTRYQMAPILVGEGENGKSVILDVIAGTFPTLLRCSVTPDDLETNRFASSRLVGKALNCVAEIPSGDLLTSAKIKAVIDGSEQSAERKNRDGFDFRPRAGHIFSANGLPHTRDLSHGFFRRFAPLTCTAPKLTREERRPRLAGEILETELPKVVGYAMRYYEAMVMERRSYTEVPSVAAATTSWRGDSDSVQQWVDDECEKGGETAIKELYSAYKRYAADSGTRCVALRTFGARLAALGYPPARSESARTRALSLSALARAAIVASQRFARDDYS